MEEVRAALDADSFVVTIANGRLPLANPVGVRAEERLFRAGDEVAGTFIIKEGTRPLHARKGQVISYSPLVGLGLSEAVLFGDYEAPVLVALRNEEIFGLAEKARSCGGGATLGRIQPVL